MLHKPSTSICPDTHLNNDLFHHIQHKPDQIKTSAVIVIKKKSLREEILTVFQSKQKEISKQLEFVIRYVLINLKFHFSCENLDSTFHGVKYHYCLLPKILNVEIINIFICFIHNY